jgi:hypothetical protein
VGVATQLLRLLLPPVSPSGESDAAALSHLGETDAAALKGKGDGEKSCVTPPLFAQACALAPVIVLGGKGEGEGSDDDD